MKALCTTESQLRKMVCASEEDVWHQITNTHKCFVLSTENGVDDISIIPDNKYLLNLHRSGKKLLFNTSIINALPKRPDYISNLSDCIYLLDITPQEASAIHSNYGVCCFSTQQLPNNPYLASRGWNIDTSDDDKEKTWDFFFKGVNRNCTSAIIMDRYLFSSAWDKKNDDPDDDIEDSYYNLEAIIDNIVPFDLQDNQFTLSIFYSHQEIKNSGKNQRNIPTFEDIVSRINDIKNTLYRPFKYDIEVISLDSDCAYYNDTHDRFIFTNYYIAEASHMLKAYKTNPQISICKQNLSFNYIYSVGLHPDDKSSIPLKTLERIVKSLVNLLKTNNTNSIKYALNGVVSTYHKGDVHNKLLK